MRCFSIERLQTSSPVTNQQANSTSNKNMLKCRKDDTLETRFPHESMTAFSMRPVLTRIILSLQDLIQM